MAAAEETKEPKAFAALEPLLTYGVKPDVHGGVHFTRSDTLLYPSGIFDRKLNLRLIES